MSAKDRGCLSPPIYNKYENQDAHGIPNHFIQLDTTGIYIRLEGAANVSTFIDGYTYTIAMSDCLQLPILEFEIAQAEIRRSDWLLNKVARDPADLRHRLR